jgi:hypothetical protein
MASKKTVAVGVGRLAVSQASDCVSKKTCQDLDTNILAHWGNRGGVSALQRVWFICEDCCPGMSWQFVYNRNEKPQTAINTLQDYVACIAAWIAQQNDTSQI